MSNWSPLTLEQLKTGLVRCAERWPERRGADSFWDGSDFCILGQIASDYGLKIGQNFCREASEFVGWWSPTIGVEHHALARRAALLNDQSVRWRQIVIELGLVPGEQPAEIPAQIDRRVLIEKEEVHA